MPVRAKFKAMAADGDGAVRLEAVTSGSVENDSFFRWTPSGSIFMSVVDPATAARFEVGKEFYVDFTPAEEG